MKALNTILFTLICFSIAIAQQPYVHQVIFLNEGWFDFVNNKLVIPPSIGTYDMATQQYHVFDEIPEAEFASDLLVSDVIYVAADNLLITYDKETLTRLQTANIPGIRSMAIWQDQLLVSRGDYLVTFDSYFQVYDRNTLEFLYELDVDHDPEYASETILVRNDTAYLAINNGFVFGEEVGFIGIIDLQNRTYAGQIDLGTAGINPEHLMADEDHIYTFNNKNFLSSSIAVIDPMTREYIMHDYVAANSGCGTSTLAADHIYFMEYGVDKLARFDLNTAQIVDTLANTAAYYGMITDPINQQLIATWTDYFSQGIAYFLDYEGNVTNTFDVGVSPGNIALDIRTTTSAVDPQWAESPVNIFPNPASDHLYVSAENEISEIRMIDPYGRVLFQAAPFSVTSTVATDRLQSGIYFVQVTLKEGGKRVYRVVKE